MTGLQRCGASQCKSLYTLACSLTPVQALGAGQPLVRLPPSACLSYDSGTDSRVLRLIQGVPEELWGARLALQVLLPSPHVHDQLCTKLPTTCFGHVGERSRMPRTTSAASPQRGLRLKQSTVCISRCCLLTCCGVCWLRPARLVEQRPAQEAVLACRAAAGRMQGALVEPFNCFGCLVSNGLAYTPLASALVHRVQDFAHLSAIPALCQHSPEQLTSAALPRR